jgi:hypothetical protein
LDAGTDRDEPRRRYPLVRIAEAHARADYGRKVGNVVVAMDDP